MALSFKYFPKISYFGDKKGAKQLWRLGLLEYYKLRALMKFQNLEQHDRITKFSDGTIIKCSHSFNEGFVEIFVPPFAEQQLKKEGEQIVVLVVFFIPSAVEYASCKYFLWDVRNNCYLNKFGINGITDCDALFTTISEKLSISGQKACYYDFVAYGKTNFPPNVVGAPSFSFDDSYGNECYSSYTYRTGDDSEQNTVSYTRPDGISETDLNFRREAIDLYSYYSYGTADYGCFSACPSNIPVWFTTVHQGLGYRRRESYRTITSYIGSYYARINVDIGYNEIVCFPVKVVDYSHDPYVGGNYEEAIAIGTREISPGCIAPVTTPVYELKTGEQYTMRSPLGEEVLFHSGNEYYGNCGDAGHATENIIRTAYDHDIVNDVSGFWGQSMYQLCVGIAMRTSQHTYYCPDLGPVIINDMDVKCIAGCARYNQPANAIDPRTQDRNSELEAAIVDLVHESTLQAAIDDLEIPGEVGAFLAQI